MSSPGEGGGRLGLTEVSTDDLKQLLEALHSGALRAPLSAIALDHAGFGFLKPALLPFKALDRDGLCPVLDAVLAERTHSRTAKLELVWSGTDAGPSYTRYTKIVIPELISGAKRHITIAGYSFDKGAGVFEDLHDALVNRNVRVRFFLDIQQLRARLEQQLNAQRNRLRLLPLKAARLASSELYARAVVGLFLDLYWPFEGTKPELFYDPRTADSKSYASLHAKCLIVDHERALITSANFTDRGQARNIEVGVLIHDKGYALALERQWNNLVESGGVVRGA